jgi:FkbM family methyltransferase
MLLAKAQNFIVRRIGVLVKKGFIAKGQTALFHPRSRLYFGNWLPSAAYKDVFVREHYRSPVALPESARIVDGGANIGLSSLYFLSRYPQAHIDAFEANPATGALLEKTLASARFATGRYKIHKKALHTEDGTIAFYVVPGVASALNSSIDGRDQLRESGEKIEVEAVDIRTLLTDRIDLLKLDIEGHEYKILEVPEITPQTVRAMVIEFHDMDKHTDECGRIFSRFKDAGYRMEIPERPALDLTDPSTWVGSHIINIYMA